MARQISKVEETDVHVVSYDAEWPKLFEDEAKLLQEALGGGELSIEHFGSTAVPGLSAKPIVDILIGSKQDSPVSGHLEKLASLGYEFLGEDGRRPGRYFFRKRGTASFNLSIVPLDSALWQENLMVRDYLRANPEESERYTAVKHQGMAVSSHSLLGYQDSKRDYMEEMKARGLQYFANLQ